MVQQSYYYGKEYRRKNRERIKKRKAEYYQVNKEKIKKYGKKYYKENKKELRRKGKIYNKIYGQRSEVKKRKKEYNKKNEDRIQVYWGIYAEKNREKIKERYLKRKASGGIKCEGCNILITKNSKSGLCLSCIKIGEQNPSWNGGTSFSPYDKNWTNKFKRAIRKRDNQVCMNCGIHREKLSKVLFIHHINYDKKLTIPQNCISLCNNCHSLTNHNRERWQGVLQSVLNKRYGYLYTEDQSILSLYI